MVDTALAKDRIKCNPAIRFLWKPFMMLHYKRADRQYQRSADSSWIRSQCGRHQGKRCFIVGNGSSLKLRDLELIKGEYSFASNGIYHLFEKTEWRPTYYVAVDRYFLESEASVLANLDLPCVLVDLYAKDYLPRRTDRLIFINLHMDRFSLRKYSVSNISFSKDPSVRISGGYTVTYAAMQLALYMGFKEIVLLGVDHNYSQEVTSNNRIIVRGANNDHFFKDASAKGSLYYEGVEYAYKLAKDEAEKADARIVNATRGGELEIFDKVPLEEVLKS